ncbi:MAG: 4Fe-4S binding protein [Chloroflexi bacterium]|nr:4Fe-4S binding protein [Chloroflexota bacterium]
MIEARLTRRLVIGKIDRYRCTGCGVCVQSCLNDVIRMKAGKAIIVYQDDCSQCFACIEDCPRNAISMRWIEKEVRAARGSDRTSSSTGVSNGEISLVMSGKSENSSKEG